MAVHHDSGYEAARTGAAVYDRSGRGKVVVAGSDRRSYLHAMLTNDIAALQPGTGCYAAYLTPQGRMIADMRVLELGDLVLMDLDAARNAEVLQKLDEFIFSEDVQLGDVSDTFGLVSVVGPSAAMVLATVLSGPSPTATTPEAMNAWPEFGSLRATFSGETAIAVSSTELGVRGFDVFTPAPAAGSLVEALVASGAARLTPQDVEVLRVEAARPAFGIDMDSNTIPLEAGIEGRAVSFTKGCYPGQEVIVRVLHRGHGRVVRKLAGLVLEGDVVPQRGDPLRAGDRDAGRVTSAVLSPAVGRPIALAMVARDFLEPGTALTVQRGDLHLAAHVTPLPFA
jgi:folate-binding protein YgfZ